MLNVCFGYMLFFLISFSPNLVYVDAQIFIKSLLQWGEGSPDDWTPPPYGAWFWIPYNLKGFFDAVFTFKKAKRLILDQPFIAELFGLPEWLRFVATYHQTTQNHS